MDQGVVLAVRFTSINGETGMESEFRLPPSLIVPVKRFTAKRAGSVYSHLKALGFPDNMKISPRKTGPYHGKRGECVLSVTVATEIIVDKVWRDGKWEKV